MEPLTFGQKIAFAGVLLFVVTLTAIPFFSNSGSGKKQSQHFKNKTITRLVAK